MEKCYLYTASSGCMGVKPDTHMWPLVCAAASWKQHQCFTQTSTFKTLPLTPKISMKYDRQRVRERECLHARACACACAC